MWTSFFYKVLTLVDVIKENVILIPLAWILLKPEYANVVIYTFLLKIVRIEWNTSKCSALQLILSIFFVGYGYNFILAAIISPAEDFYLMSEVMTPFSRNPHFDCKPALIQMTIFIVTVLLHAPAPAFNGELSWTKNSYLDQL